LYFGNCAIQFLKIEMGKLDYLTTFIGKVVETGENQFWKN
jgi:hypothetical protein